MITFLFFTFHNVSINTAPVGAYEVNYDFFTFHNVSINTGGMPQGNGPMQTLHSTMFLLILLLNFYCQSAFILYIPQCFY